MHLERRQSRWGLRLQEEVDNSQEDGKSRRLTKNVCLAMQRQWDTERNLISRPCWAPHHPPNTRTLPSPPTSPTSPVYACPILPVFISGPALCPNSQGAVKGEVEQSSCVFWGMIIFSSDLSTCQSGTFWQGSLWTPSIAIRENMPEQSLPWIKEIFCILVRLRCALPWFFSYSF